MGKERERESVCVCVCRGRGRGGGGGGGIQREPTVYSGDSLPTRLPNSVLTVTMALSGLAYFYDTDIDKRLWSILGIIMAERGVRALTKLPCRCSTVTVKLADITCKWGC